jgi:anti-sigma regulatory factor (Ser/Thr protein kinase)
METMAPTRPTVHPLRRISLRLGPAAAAEARCQVEAAIYAYRAPVDVSVAVLLASELVTNAIRHQAGETAELVIDCTQGELRVDVHDTSGSMPVLMDAAGDAESGRGLMLVATLSTDWGCYRTAPGKAVYFTLAFTGRRDDEHDRGPRSGAVVTGQS